MFQTNVFDNDVFQQLWNPASTTVTKVFQSNIFDGDVFQTTSFTTDIVPAVFQSGVFQYNVFATEAFNKLKQSTVVFQPYVFQSNVFQAAIGRTKAVYETVGITDVITIVKGDVKTAVDNVGISEQVNSIVKKTVKATVTESVAISETNNRAVP